jgi:hypothetical protein
MMEQEAPPLSCHVAFRIFHSYNGGLVYDVLD